MLEPSNEIVIIDDNLEELERLSSVFYKNGIGCRTFQYENSDPDNPSLTGVRFLFLDLHLAPVIGKDEKLTFSIIMDVLKNYISEDNGPYALIFWTKNMEWCDKLIAYINREDNEVRNNRKPYYINHIDKSEFQEEGELNDKLEKIFTSKTVQTLLSFEKSISSAAHDTLSKLIELIPKGDKWGDCSSFEENFKKIFTKIAIASTGCKHAKKDPDKAINEALCSIYADTLMNQKNDHWRDYLGEINTRENWPENFSVSDLNTIFHIDTHTESIDEKHRGVVHEIKNGVHMYTNLLGSSKRKILHDLFPGLTKKERGNINLIALKFSNDSIDPSFSFSIEATSKYILGVVFSSKVKEIIEFKAKQRKEKTSPSFCYTSVFDIEHDDIKKESVIICLNFDFVFTVEENEIDKTFNKSFLNLRKELMNLIVSNYANYMSRLESTCFE